MPQRDHVFWSPTIALTISSLLAFQPARLPSLRRLTSIMMGDYASPMRFPRSVEGFSFETSDKMGPLFERLDLDSSHHQGCQRNSQGISVGMETHMNQSISDRRSSIDMILHKRFSLDLAGNSDHFSTFHFDEPDRVDFRKPDIGDFSIRSVKFESEAKKPENFGEEVVVKKKKRKLSLGFLGPSFFEDHAKNGSSIRKKESEEFQDEYDADPSESEVSIEVEPIELDPIHVKQQMEGFTSAMAKSQKSQQAIHDWDRQMGLKRSHSKTMRLSMRSRKKLRVMLKKEITVISSKVEKKKRKTKEW